MNSFSSVPGPLRIRLICRLWSIASSALVGLACAAVIVIGVATIGWADTTTYHNNPARTGWVSTEQILTARSVGSPEFGLLHKVPLDDQVDAQPLIVTNQPIQGMRFGAVVYVATENNTVYAIDASTGNVLLTAKLGTPVP